MKIAYFTNQYPKVSHSFIRREIIALESLGHEVVRFAIKCNKGDLLDPSDKDEFSKTKYVLSESFINIFLACLFALFSSPIKFISTFYSAVSMGVRSDRGVIRHIAYFVEACILKQWQVSHKIEHTHAHFGTNSTTVVLFSYLLGGSGYSFTVHGPEEFDKPEFIHLPQKIKHSRFVVAISSFGKSQLCRWVPLEYWGKIKIVHCAVDSLFLDTPYKDLPKDIQFFSIGRLAEQKGQLLMVEAIYQLKLKGVNVKLTLVGDGPLKQEIEKLIKEKGLSDNIIMTGALSGNGVIDVIDQSSVLLLPSFAEGLPVVIMESLARGRPVISTFIAGIPELVIPNYTGWLVHAGNETALSDMMEHVASLPSSELAKIGEQGRAEVINSHFSETEAKKLATYIEDVVQE